MKVKPQISLLDNSRFYIVVGSVLLSLIIFFGLQVTMANESVRYIRLQQIYGLFAVADWYVVLLISAYAKVAGQKAWLPAMLFTRRAFGSMVAYFAVLHTVVATVDQLDGWSGIKLLPTDFLWSLGLGLFAVLVLVAMAALSIDKIVALVKFKQWKILQNISYLAGVAAVVHVWIIGAHVSSLIIQLLAFEALIILFGLQAWRLGKVLKAKKYSTQMAALLAVGFWLVLSCGLIGMKLYVASYSKTHAAHSTGEGVILHAH